ncbi:MAG: prepilin peptidase [Candidatus Nanoarchaeia archaeon]|nr:prepilin peptidase [Candidatus Nanoarchaeia archaeon]
MIEIIFLLALALIWIIFAMISDFKTTEIPNWLSFSLIIFALGFRFFYSLFSAGDFSFFYQGLIGFGIFLVIGNLMYYGKIFGGGDARLIYGLGAILPFSNNIFTNLEIFISFLMLYLSIGGVYGLLAGGYFALKNSGKFRKEFKILFRKNLKFSLIIMMLGILIMIPGLIFNKLFLLLGILIFLLPMLYIFAKSTEESCMKKNTAPKLLREGDLLYSDVKLGKKLIKAEWGGLSKEEIKLLQRRNKLVMIKHGIAFSIVFLISLLLLIYIYFINTSLWNSFW